MDVVPAKTGITKAAYASAAIRYFAELGIDPTQQTAGTGLAEVTHKLAELSQQVGTMQETARKQSADIGNRLVGIWRVLENNLYQHLNTEQHALLLYLEKIEENLLGKVSETEASFLYPLMERLLLVAGESMTVRSMGNHLVHQVNTLVPPGTVPQSRMSAAATDQTLERDKYVAREAKAFLEATKLAERRRTQRPSITAAPGTAIPKPQPKPAPTQP